MKFGNRVTEKDLRDWLDNHGYAGKFAKVEELELHAIQRPGWVQVFRFEIQVRVADIDQEATDESHAEVLEEPRPWLQRWGVILDDERRRKNKTQVWMYESLDQCESQLGVVSEGFIVKRRRR